jgi:hypothetical protein
LLEARADQEQRQVAGGEPEALAGGRPQRRPHRGSVALHVHAVADQDQARRPGWVVAAEAGLDEPGVDGDDAGRAAGDAALDGQDDPVERAPRGQRAGRPVKVPAAERQPLAVASFARPEDVLVERPLEAQHHVEAGGAGQARGEPGVAERRQRRAAAGHGHTVHRDAPCPGRPGLAEEVRLVAGSRQPPQELVHEALPAAVGDEAPAEDRDLHAGSRPARRSAAR